MITIHKTDGNWSIKIEPSDLFWSGETWARGDMRMRFRTREVAEKYLEFNRSKLDESPLDEGAAAENR